MIELTSGGKKRFGGEIEFFFMNQDGTPSYHIDTRSKEGIIDTFDIVNEYIKTNNILKSFLCKEECLPSMIELITKDIYEEFQQLEDVILEGRHEVEKIASTLGLTLRDEQYIPESRKTNQPIQRIKNYEYGKHILKLLHLLEPGLDRHMSTTGLHIHVSDENEQETIKLRKRLNTQLFIDKKNDDNYYLSYGMSEDRYINRGRLVILRAQRSILCRHLIHIKGFTTRNKKSIIDFYHNHFPNFDSKRILALHDFFIQGQSEGWITDLEITAPEISLIDINSRETDKGLYNYLTKRYNNSNDEIVHNMFLGEILKDHSWLPLKRPRADLTVEFRTLDAGNEATLLNSFQCFRNKVL